MARNTQKFTKNPQNNSNLDFYDTKNFNVLLDFLIIEIVTV